MSPAGFQHMEDAFQINLAIEDRLFHRSRDHRLRCQMDDGIKMMVGKDSVDSLFIADIALDELHPGRYVVPIMFEDYMFSFIVEEYGLIGGILVIILYISLLARGSLIVRNCDNLFAKTAVAGLVILITGQAMMHIMINCDLGPLTGQTLPMISHGKSSFLMFCLAFGIILSISRMAKKKIK